MKQLYKICLPLTSFLSVIFGDVQGNDFANKIDYSCEYSPCCEEGRLFFKVDALYWKAHQDGLENIISSSVTNSVSIVTEDLVTDTLDFDQKTSRFNFDWRGGYRLGLGCDLYCGWIMALDWTHYRGHAHGHGKLGNLRRSGHWKLDYDVVDFIFISPNCCLASCVTWNAFGGIRSARINQHLSARNEDLLIGITQSTFNEETTIDTETQLTTTRLRDREHFNAVGPELGINADWDLGCGFSIYGNVVGAIVFGHFHNKENRLLHADSVTVGDDPATSQVNFTELNSSKDRVCEPVVDLGLGMRWQRHFCYCNYETDLVLKLGWEHHQWFNHSHLGIFNSEKAGDLYFDGVTFSAALFY